VHREAVDCIGSPHAGTCRIHAWSAMTAVRTTCMALQLPQVRCQLSDSQMLPPRRPAAVRRAVSGSRRCRGQPVQVQALFGGKKEGVSELRSTATALAKRWLAGRHCGGMSTR
jgi:hypothetical protein